VSATPYLAIAAMSLNRVIGQHGRIPWHLPEDFKWFKQTTIGHTLVMGRKTFESIGRPLPQRTTVILSRAGITFPGTKTIRSLAELNPDQYPGKIFIAGGSEIYQQTLPLCSDLYLTVVQREVVGDAFFPAFEDQFTLREVIAENHDFKILHYVRLVS
jgi:dihydrofolate reductase